MNIDVAFISGMMFGIEFFSADLLSGGGMIIDLGIVRILFEKDAE